MAKNLLRTTISATTTSTVTLGTISGGNPSRGLLLNWRSDHDGTLTITDKDTDDSDRAYTSESVSVTGGTPGSYLWQPGCDKVVIQFTAGASDCAGYFSVFSREVE